MTEREDYDIVGVAFKYVTISLGRQVITIIRCSPTRALPQVTREYPSLLSMKAIGNYILITLIYCSIALKKLPLTSGSEALSID